MRRLQLRTTRARLTLLSIGMLAIAAVVADGGLYSIAVFYTARASDDSLRHQAELIASGLEMTNGGAKYDGGDLPAQGDDGLATDISVVGDNGLISTTSGNPLRTGTLEALAAPVLRTRRPIWVDISDSRHVQRRVYAMPVASTEPPVALIVERSVESQNSSLGWIRWLLACLSVMFVGVGGLVAYLLTGRVLKPVRDIAALAQSLSERNLHLRIKIPVPQDELGELVDTFNGMLSRLEVSFETMSRFIADASHELRGPLTHMRNEIELRRRRGGDAGHTLDALEAEITHLSDMVDKLLLLARADAGVLRPARRELDVADFLHEVAARWSSTARAHGVRLQVDAPDSGVVLADPTLTRRVLDNLVENAVRHSPRRGLVSLRATSRDGAWVFEVADQGSGVPHAARPTIFERFTRVDGARTRSGLGGTGLGLAVSATLARVQEADLELVDGPQEGAVFRLTFAAAPGVEVSAEPVEEVRAASV